MYNYDQALYPTQLAHFCSAASLPKLDPEMVLRQRADQHWLACSKQGEVVARCSLWWQSTPLYQGHRLGFIGHYAALDAQAGDHLLQFVCDQLAQQNCTMAVGPIDGNTWQSYRYVVETSEEPSFFLEPQHPDTCPAHLSENGFTPLAHYFSAINTDLERRHPHRSELEAQMAAYNITTRPLKLDQFEAELRRIYPLILDSFQDNFLYSPICLEDFIAQYCPIQPYLDPNLILVADYDGYPIGFAFAVPDIHQMQRGQTMDTVVFKTIAVHPDWTGIGLGALLFDSCQAQAYKRGFRRVIHAMMHETNASRKISKHYGKTIRRYALFAKPLAA
ncbi:MAG: GNAT family N-acetyltransferase [Chloroflexota bacterium]